ncbi:MAG: DUF4412 domain-containing protein [Acidobacteria bacterium]|nr:DUF4412 domain-containing protein [Acidobacteriota bacterium]
MMRQLARVLAMAVTSAALVAAPRAAQVGSLFSEDVTLHETTTSSGMPMGGGKESRATSYFSGNAMRHSSDAADTIIRYDQGKIITVDHKKKTYTEITLQDLQRALESAAAGMNMKKEEMEAMRQMMGQTTGETTVTKQGPGEAIAGYSTEKYLVKMPMLEMQIWTASDLAVPAVYYDAMKLSMPPNPMFDMGKMYDEFKKIKGMTVKTVMNMSMMGMNMSTTTVVTSVEKGKIPASTFDVPAGYKSVPMKM